MDRDIEQAGIPIKDLEAMVASGKAERIKSGKETVAYRLISPAQQSQEVSPAVSHGAGTT